MSPKPKNIFNPVDNFEIASPKAEKTEFVKPDRLERDSKPMTADELKAARRIPRVTTLRRALHMTQDQFSAEFGIPVGTLRDWEQGRAEPDATARAYLFAIAGDAEAVSKARMAGAAYKPAG